MPLWMAVGLGGALGSMARHGVNVVTTSWLGRPGPLATAVANLAGCAVIGFLAGSIASGRLPMSASMRAFVFVGILGGFTTFSSFGLDTLTLARQGSAPMAVLNVAGQVGLGLLAVFTCYGFAAR